MQVLGKTLRCFSVILAFSKSLHESCRLFAFYRRAADFFLFTGCLPRFDSIYQNLHIHAVRAKILRSIFELVHDLYIAHRSCLIDRLMNMAGVTARSIL